MLELLFSSPLARKAALYGTLVVALLAGFGVEEMRIRYAHSQEEKARAAMVLAQTQRDQALAANASLHQSIDKQNKAIQDLFGEMAKAKARQAIAEHQAAQIDAEYQQWLMRLRGASVPQDDKGAWAWFTQQYDDLNSKFQKVESK